VREYIYRQKWRNLRPIQERAIGAILDGPEHILIAAPTASGKTEAVFLPLISVLLGEGAAGMVLYVSPLKALINDQFERLSGLLDRAEIPVWRWHGDAPQAGKRRFLERAAAPGGSGILQITPESLEALLLGRPEKTAALFQGLAFVVIDEVHALMGSDRGGQLLCLLARIEEAADCRPRRIGLSATLGDYRAAAAWLTGGTGDNSADSAGPDDASPAGPCRLIRDGGAKKRIRVALDYFSGSAENPEAPYYDALYKQCRGGGFRRGKCIIFTNSRLEAEETAAALRDLARRRGEEDVFYVHHGSVSGALRAEAEREMKEREGPVVTAATATLELGIDIGRLDRIIQIGPPPSAAAFAQRLGRAGRRGKAAEIYCTGLESPRDGEDVSGRIPWGLLKTIAVVQLYLEEGWIEPPPPLPYPASLLCHETLAILGALGELRAGDLARRVLSLPVFGGIPRDDYRELLQNLMAGDYIRETGEGTLITGGEGERLLGHHSFYAVFPGERVFRVLWGGRELGTVHFLPPRGTSLTLGGRYWRVDGFDVPRREISVSPGEGGGERVWRGGGTETHRRIAERARRVLTEGLRYPYLSERAWVLLEGARREAESAGIGHRTFVPAETPEGGGDFFIFPWLGSRGTRTLLVLLRGEENRERLGIRGVYRKNDFALRVSSRIPLGEFEKEMGNLIRALPPPGEAARAALADLLDPDKLPYINKYDYLLPPRLLVKQYAANMLAPEELSGV
jgi:ATP-dependent Lhr-like helicase